MLIVARRTPVRLFSFPGPASEDSSGG